MYFNVFFFPSIVDTVETAFALDADEFKAKYGVAKPSVDAPELVFHCQMGRRGQAATDKAIALGFLRYISATSRHEYTHSLQSNKQPVI